MGHNCVTSLGFLCLMLISGGNGLTTPALVNHTRSGFLSLDVRNTVLMDRFVVERFNNAEPSYHRYEFTGIQEIEEYVRRVDHSSNGSFPRSNASSHEMGNLYQLHYDTMRMFRIAFLTIFELEISLDGTTFVDNLNIIIGHMHKPVTRLRTLVERHPCNSSSFDFTNFSVEFETTSSGQVCSDDCLHRQSYHILQKFKYFLRRAEETFTSLTFT